jgi:hypothetical protein
MSQDDLDQLLSHHGEQWRDSNAARPAVDWPVVTTTSRRRTWLAVAGVAVAAAAVIVPIAVMAGHSSAARPSPSGAPSPPALPTPRDPLDYQHGAPSQYFGLTHGNIAQVGEIVGRTHERPPVVAIGGLGVGTGVYTAAALPNCQTRLDETVFAQSGRGVQLNGEPRSVATLAGQPAATSIAVSERSGLLAMVVTPAYRGHYTGNVLPCVGPQQIVFVDLKDGKVVSRLSATAGEQIDSLQWSRTGGNLLYRIESQNPGSAIAAPGTHVMTTDEGPRSLDSYPTVLPLTANAAGATYGPAIYRHGALAAFFDGNLYRIEVEQGNSRSAVLATGFPGKVDTVARDASGRHLLITAGGRSYRWDYGKLTRLPGHLLQPTW